MNGPFRPRIARAAIVAAVLAAGASPAFAATFTWVPVSGAGTWTDSGNWTSTVTGTFPNSVDDSADVGGQKTGNMTITLNQPITLRTLSFGDTNNPYYSTTLTGTTSGLLMFSSTTGTATLSMKGSVNQTAAGENIFNVGMQLANTLDVRFTTSSGPAQIVVTGSVTASTAGLKMIRYVAPSTATTTYESYVNFRGNITDGSGQIGILQNCLAPNSVNSLKLTGTGNSFSGPVQILSKAISASPASGTNGALGTGPLQLGDVSGTSSATLNLGGSLSTVTERNAITVPEGNSGARTIAVTGTGNRILSGSMSVQNAGGVTLACSSAGDLTFSNAISGTGPITISSTSGSGKVIFSGNGSTHSGTVTIQSRGLQLAGGSALAASKIVPLAGGTMTLAPALQATVGGLSPNAGGLIDVGSGYVTVAAGLSAAEMLVALNAGRRDGSWSGTSGITSSTAAADLAVSISRTVGWLDNGDGSVAFAFAAPGDTNLDWNVDILDAANFLAGGKFDSGTPATWNEGDFGYDGVVDILDAADFLTTGLYNTGAYNPPAGAAGVVAAVPEPVGLGAIALAAVALVVHRRTRR